jgi:glycolate oxidase
MKMPAPDAAVLLRRAEIVETLRRIVPGEERHRLRRRAASYEGDRLTAYRQLPMVVCAVARREQRRCCAIASKPASRSYRAAPVPRSRVARCRSPTACCSAGQVQPHLDIDATTAVSSPGLVLQSAITQAVEPALLRAGPLEPDSLYDRRQCCGNSGGVHCLKYGVTTNNILGIEMVLMDGAVLRLGGSISTPRATTCSA